MADKPTFYVTRSYLKAALRIAPKNDIRYFLNSVFIEADATHTTMVTTNGHVLLVLRQKAENKLEKPVSVIMPREVCESILKLNIKPLPAIGIAQESDDEFSTLLTSLAENSTLHFRSIEAAYPDWKRVIPEKVSGEAGTFNPEYLLTFKKVADDIGGSFLHIQNGPNEGSVVCLAAEMECFAIVMPMRGNLNPEAWKVPDWAQKPKEKSAPKKKAVRVKKEMVAA